MYKVRIQKSAAKILRKLPSEYQLKMHDAVKKLRENPFILDIKKLHAPYKASHRLRLGAYRIFLNINTTTKEIIIVEIVRRTTRTYN